MALYDSNGKLVGEGTGESDPTVPDAAKQLTAARLAGWDSASRAVNGLCTSLLGPAVSWTTTNTGQDFVWNNVPALEQFAVPLTALRSNVLLCGLSFRAQAPAAGTLTLTVRRYGEATALFTAQTELIKGENAVTFAPGLLLEKGVEYALDFAAPGKLGYPVVLPAWRAANADLDAASASEYKYNNSDLIFAGDITYQVQSDLAAYASAVQQTDANAQTLAQAAQKLRLEPYHHLLGAADASAVDAKLTVSGTTLTVAGHAGQYAAWRLPTDSAKQYLRITASLIALTGGMQLVLAGQSRDGSGEITRLLLSPTAVGPVDTGIDLAWHAVYTAFDLSKPLYLRAVLTTADSRAVLADLSIAEKVLDLDGVGDAGATLGNVLEGLQAAQGQTVNTPPTLVSPGGARYVLQVSDAGEAVLVPAAPRRALFIGNSILLGFASFGMCASHAEADYYHRVTAVLAARDAAFTAERAAGMAIEAATDTDAFDTAYAALAAKVTADLDLIVVQLGDNVNTAAKLAYFAHEGAERLLHRLRTAAPRARVVWMAAWYSSSERRTAIRTACAQTGCTFVDISDLAVDANRSSIGAVITHPDGTTSTVTDAGVASHPGDAGMQAIADRLITALGLADSGTL